MYTNVYMNLYNALLKDFNADEFILVKRCAKRSKILKVILGLVYVIMSSSVLLPLSIGFPVLILSLVIIFYCQNKIKYYTELLGKSEKFLESTMGKYVGSIESQEFRDKQLDRLEQNQMSKTEYLDIVREDMQLLYHLIQAECAEEESIDVVGYKSSIKSLLSILENAVDKGLLNKDDVEIVKRKWCSDLQILCNYYAKTHIEVELKYLYAQIKNK